MEDISVPRANEIGRTRDKFKGFRQFRSNYTTLREKEYDKILNKYKMISFSAYSSKLIPSNNNSSWLRSNRKSEQLTSLAIEEENVEALQAAVDCAICETPFAGYFTKGKRYQCPLCSRIVCKKCFSKEYALEPIKAAMMPDLVKMTFCDWCISDIGKAKRKEEWQTIKQTAENDPVLKISRLLSELMATIESDLYKLKHVLYEIGNEHTTNNTNTLKHMEKLAAEVGIFFLNFDKALKALNAIPPKHKKQESVHNNIKMRCTQFFSEKMPEYRLLQKQVTVISALPIKTVTEPQRLTAIPSLKEKKKGDQMFTLPEINTVHPVIVPTGGGTITITGRNFSPHMTVSVAGIDNLPIDYVDSTELNVTVPPSSEGTKLIKVTNPDGGFATLDQVLFYSSAITPPAHSKKNTQSGNSVNNNNNNNINSSHRKSASLSGGDINMRSSGNSAARRFSSFSIQDDYETNSETAPTIETINPAFSPMSGGLRMQVTGSHFFSAVVLKIGGKIVPQVTFSGGDERAILDFESPPMVTEGFKDVEVLNPDGSNFVLQNAVFYSKDFADITSIMPPKTPASKVAALQVSKSMSSGDLNDIRTQKVYEKRFQSNLLVPQFSNSSSNIPTADGDERNTKSVQSGPRPPVRVWGKPAS